MPKRGNIEIENVGEKLTHAFEGSRKRPRIQAYIEKKIRYESVKRTCTFFETELELITTPSSVCSDVSTGTEECYNRITNSKGLENARRSIRKQMEIYDEQFTSYRKSLTNEVHEKLQLRESFDLLSYGIDEDSKNSNSISILNQGPETTAVIKGLISKFAGVPSINEVSELQELSLHLKKF